MFNSIHSINTNKIRCTGKFIRFLVASLTVLGFVFTTMFLLSSGNLPPAVIQRLSSQKLVKRNRWFWAATAALGGVLIAAASNIQAAWTPILCAVPTNPACWYLGLGTTIATAVGLIAVGAASVGSTRADTRDLSNIIGFHSFETNHSTGLDSSYSRYLENLGISHVTPVHINSDNKQLLKRSELYGIKNMWSMTLDLNQIHKRDLGIEKASSTAQTGLYWESDYGVHFGVHLSETIVENFVNVVFDSNPGVPSGVGNNSRLSKRQGFKVDWVSFNYDNANRDLCEDIAQDRGLEYALAESGSDFFKTAATYKYCGAATKNDHVGIGQNYNDLGSENAVHGEWYFNTYGGIDGYCNDNKDGAQCSVIGCQ